MGSNANGSYAIKQRKIVLLQHGFNGNQGSFANQNNKIRSEIYEFI